jgi:hypothetical protein
MNVHRSVDEAKVHAIHRRLVLAKDILEDSDKLPGRLGIIDVGSAYLKHPRHDREALVIYLLLTCFDFLGQPAEYRTFREWLESNDSDHKTQRNEVIGKLDESASPTEISLALAKAYDLSFGVKNSFFKGIFSLPQSSRDLVLNSIHLFEAKDWRQRSPTTSVGASPLERSEDELQKIKLQYLYLKRNRFTHSLEQQDHLSAPGQSLLGLGLFDENSFRDMDIGACWIASLTSQGIQYHCQFDDEMPRKTRMLVKVKDWPFLLFEALYDVIDIPFDKTSIDLSFQVYRETDSPCYPTWAKVPHSSLYSLLLPPPTES